MLLSNYSALRHISRPFSALTSLPPTSSLSLRPLTSNPPKSSIFSSASKLTTFSAIPPSLRYSRASYVTFHTSVPSHSPSSHTHHENAPVDLAYTHLSPSASPFPNDLPNTLVLHGLFGSGNNWRTISNKMSESTNSNIYLMDLRNHGSSPHVSRMDYPIMAEDVATFIKKHKLGKVSIIGHSMGGKTSMLLALTHPELVKKLIVVDIAPHSLSNSKNVFSSYSSAMLGLDLSKIHSRKQADEALKPVIEDMGVRQFVLTNLTLDEHGKFKWKCNLKVLHESMSNLMLFPDTAKPFTGPTLFIGGSLSKYIQEKHHPAIHEKFPNSEIVKIEGAGHWVHAEKPKEFLQLATDFLNKK